MSGLSPNEKKMSGSATNIPIRRVVLNDPSAMPADYSTTPGGTLFSTTPGGTRIIYDRAFLMQCRNSPLTKSPPPNLPRIPGVTCPEEKAAPQENGHGRPPAPQKPPQNKNENGDEPQFEMDI
ncbi:hypothetical protein CAPTEDRAFT_171289 [Capitella teleta]|uniref:Eukaryotic translation initiation factor 4E binding protein 1 n=1 Tax=Capitella teleta TaxID=283909 RepID=R7VLT8_CAPTE|nr:hypothetical protein CAPTEDRAFT_171289 [Capitella teleta]|eukprot:ELU17900.1 hypothetical protein CAPTEDRAFT_171289 [Capitella teleta]